MQGQQTIVVLEPDREGRGAVSVWKRGIASGHVWMGFGEYPPPPGAILQVVAAPPPQGGSVWSVRSVGLPQWVMQEELVKALQAARQPEQIWQHLANGEQYPVDSVMGWFRDRITKGEAGPELEDVLRYMYWRRGYAKITNHNSRNNLTELIGKSELERLDGRNPYLVPAMMLGEDLWKWRESATARGDFLAADGKTWLEAWMGRSVREEQEAHGTTILQKQHLVMKSAALSRTGPKQASQLIGNEVWGMPLQIRSRNGREYCGLTEVIKGEEEIAQRMLEIHRAAPLSGKKREWAARQVIERYAQQGVMFVDQQAECVRRLGERGISVLAGGPGTGKTTVLKASLEAIRLTDPHIRFLMCAPTGKAAHRMEAAVGIPAITLHRAMGYLKRGVVTFDVLVVDEASMISNRMMLDLLRHFPEGARLVLVGDIRQLPPIEPGYVFRDVIRSGAFNEICLTRTHRQAQHSMIIRNASRINTGKPPEAGHDYVRVRHRQDPESIVRYLVQDLVPRAIREHGKDGVQVLTPMRNGPMGTRALNTALQPLLNQRGISRKKGVTVGGVTYYPGDRVIQTSNDYHRGVMNGDVGVVTQVQPAENLLIVRYGKEEAEYRGNDLRSLDLAYAITVHKSQGSEYEAVIVIAGEEHKHMMSREFMMTAITRASKIVYDVTHEEAMKAALEVSVEKSRQTGLAELLVSGIRKEAPVEPPGERARRAASAPKPRPDRNRQASNGPENPR